MTGQKYPKAAAFWQGYLASLPPDADIPAQFETWYFGDSEAMAAELGHLVAAGTKTATCGLLWEYEFEGEALPEAGEFSVIVDYHGEPICIIETTEISVKPYYQVDAQFAHDEGEGDRSLAYWREVHWRFFSRVCEMIGKDLDESMPLAANASEWCIPFKRKDPGACQDHFTEFWVILLLSPCW